MILEKDAVDELRGHLPDYLQRSGRMVRGKMRCINPAHTDRNPSMSYDARTKRLHCFGCGKSYDLFDLIALDYPSCGTFPQQVRKACELFSIPVPDTLAAAGPPRRVTPRNVRGDYTRFVEESVGRFGCGGDYFANRGIPQFLCEKYRLFQRDSKAYLPIFQAGKCVSYCARSIDGGNPRYQNSPGPMAVFGMDGVTDTEADLLVAESIFDALSAEVCGVEAVALCGAANTGKFLELCGKIPGLANRRFLLAGDRDSAGERMNLELEQGLQKLGISCVRVQIPGEAKDLNEALIKDTAALQAAVKPPAERYEIPCAAALLKALRASGEEQRGQAVPTGFGGLDKILGGGLYPGLYVLGAVSSLGKTSFVLQMADAIAESGRDVLYFTLEMSRMELISKSVSRISRGLEGSRMKGLTMRQVMCGERTPLLERSLERYARGPGQRLFFVEEAVGTAEVRTRTERHIKARGTGPVVMVDYLQILKPADGRATDKQNTDRAVVELKRLSRDYDIPVIAVSSFNRENYRNTVSMEAFKESGAVEYSSDVLLGMQLTGAGEPRFDMNLAKLRSPRNLEVVLLKNRAGEPYAVLPLRYHAKFSLFTE